uniref:Protein disulfide-isomerase n=1 Tax=Evadne anonyx TaxID=141404 RepID=A0A9N6ZGF2_9CRUS|nr:EOG090X0438 [Evadne anonyx]
MFDVDGTLTVPRQRINEETEDFLLNKLKPKCTVGLVGGSDLKKIAEQMGGMEVLNKFDYVFAENGLVAYKNGKLIGQMNIQEHMGEEKLQTFINYALNYMSKLTIPVKRGNFIEFRSGLINVCPVALTSAEYSVDLVDDDFDSKLSTYNTALVMFYAPWCGHCKRLKPEFEKAGSLLFKNDPPVTLVKVDCTEGGKATCSKFSVQGYPTLKIFKAGEFSADYNGPREASGIAKYMRAQVGPSAKELLSVKTAESFMSKDEVTVVGFFEKSNELNNNFMTVADKLRETIKFGVSSAKDVLEKYGHKNNIVLFRPKHLSNKFESDSVVYEGSASKDEITTWVQKNYHGLVGYRTMENADQFKQPLVVAYYGVDYIKNVKGTNYWRNRVLKVAQSFKEFNFAICNKNDFQQELNEFGIEHIVDDKPRVAVRDISGSKYIMTEAFSVDNLQKFLEDVRAGKLVAYMKSEPLPDNSGPLKTAVAKNFDEVVMNNGKDTLIEFYAPWCGHCKKLAPVLEQVAQSLKDEDVAIVKMDATANDVPPNFEVRGFPTLYWLPKNSKASHVRYEGGRTHEDFMKYISQSSTDGLRTIDADGRAINKEEL